MRSIDSGVVVLLHLQDLVTAVDLLAKLKKVTETLWISQDLNVNRTEFNLTRTNH